MSALEPVAPEPLLDPELSPRPPFLPLVRIGFGVLFMLTSVSTYDEPEVKCGSVAVLVLFDQSHTPPGRADECRDQAGSQILGSIIGAFLPGAVLFGWPALKARFRLSLWMRRREQIEIARMKKTGVWTFYRYMWGAAGFTAAVVVVPLLLTAIITTDYLDYFQAAGAFGIPSPVFIYIFVIRPRVKFEDTGVLIVNPYLRRRVRWDDIVGVEPGSHQADMTLRSGEVVHVFVGQGTNWATWHGLSTRAGAMAAAIMERSRLHSPTGVTDPQVEGDRPVDRRNILRLAVVAVLLIIQSIRHR